MEELAPAVIFHLAAVANPRTCKQDFPLAFDVNVVGTQNVLRSLATVRGGGFLDPGIPFGEDGPHRARGPGVSVAAARGGDHAYAAAGGWRICDPDTAAPGLRAADRSARILPGPRRPVLPDGRRPGRLRRGLGVPGGPDDPIATLKALGGDGAIVRNIY